VQPHGGTVAGVSGDSREVTGGSPLRLGNWRLEVGGWRLEIGGWKLEIGGWRLEVGSWRLEVGGWRLEVDVVYIGFRLHVGDSSHGMDTSRAQRRMCPSALSRLSLTTIGKPI
jgi:hypothetical protein